MSVCVCVCVFFYKLYTNNIVLLLFCRDELDIRQLISRILSERQSFANITEQALQEEIASLNSKANLAEYNDRGEDGVRAENYVFKDESTGTSQQEIFNNQRMELSKDVGNALNEVSLSLDFVSLLISSVKPALSKNTMSPHLQKFVKPTSLTSDKLENETGSGNGSASGNSIESTFNENGTKNTKIGEGWKTEAIGKITRLFKESAENLKMQVAKENRYWTMVNSVKSNDEALFRMRDPVSNARSIGVKYGYGDSGSDFQDKGNALLRKNNRTGVITFVPLGSTGANGVQVSTKQYKYVRVRILSKVDEDYIVTGQSKFSRSQFKSLYEVINQIEMARYFLFEDDLFYQLSREAKILISYNITVSADKITLAFGNDIVEIESVAYDESEDGNSPAQSTASSTINNEKCQCIIIYFKLMLCCFYKYNLKLKQKVPTNLTKWKQSNSHPLILRPFLGNLRHEMFVETAEKIINDIVKSTNLQNELNIKKFTNLGKVSKNPFQKSIDKPISVFYLQLKNTEQKVLKIKVLITTNELYVNLILRLSVTQYERVEDSKIDIGGSNILLTDFNDFDDFQTSLDWTIRDFHSN